MNVNLNGYQELNGAATLLPSEQALEAIANHDAERLDALVEVGDVNAGTRTANGTTLLMEAARHRNAHALLTLSEELPLNTLQAVDPNGNNVTHYIVEYTDNAIFDDDDEQNDPHQLWRNGLTGFMLNCGQNCGYNTPNYQDITPMARAEQLEKTSFSDFMSAFLP